MGEDAHHVRERTQAMRRDNQVLVQRARQHLTASAASAAVAPSAEFPCRSGGAPTRQTVPHQHVGEPAATSSAEAPVPSSADSAGASPKPFEGLSSAPTAADRTLTALRGLLRSSHLAGPDDLPALISAAGAALGAGPAVLYLVDYDQAALVPLGAGQATDAAPYAAALEDLAVPGDAADGPVNISGTLAGRAYSDLAQHISTTRSGWTVWTPVLDGTERVGVLRLDFPEAAGDLEPELLDGCQDVAALLAEMVLTRSLYGDAVERTRRSSPLTIPAELARRALPPLTFVSPRVSIAGVVIPPEQLAGDIFDYALNGDTLHVAIFDAMGHGLQAALLASVAVGGLRNARRAGLDLAATVTAIDSTLSGHFEAGTFVTGIIGELDIAGGWWRWSTCGHPPTLLVRAGRVVKQLDTVTDPPLGLGLLGQPQIGAERLQPRDRLLLHTDGVAEARNSAGAFFGTERLVEFTSRQAAAGRPAAETLRRLNQAILEHQDGALQDDATTVMVEWLSDQPARTAPATATPA